MGFVLGFLMLLVAAAVRMFEWIVCIQETWERDTPPGPVPTTRVIEPTLTAASTRREVRTIADIPRSQYVGAKAVRSAGGSTECQVCGMALEGDLVACPGCATLHHRECWDYARGCSTFACGETRVSAPFRP